jgi:hypothetical protein
MNQNKLFQNSSLQKGAEFFGVTHARHLSGCTPKA